VLEEEGIKEGDLAEVLSEEEYLII